MPARVTGIISSALSYQGIPKTIPNLVYWLDADEEGTFTLNGSKVATWRDKSGNDVVVSQGTDTSRPVRTLSSMKAGRYSVVGTTATYMHFTGLHANHKPFSVFAAVRFGTDAAYRSIVGSDVNGMQWRINNVHKHSLVKANVVELGVSTNALAANTNHIVGVTYTSAGVYTFYNGNVANGTATNNQTFSATGVTILMASAAENFIGSIGEIVKYSRDVTTTERNTLYTYLSGKWV